MSYERFNDVRAEAITEAMADLGAARRVLDLGASDGWLSVRLAKLGHHVVAVERTEQERPTLDPSAPGSIEWVERAMYAYDLPTLGEFDVVIALSVLHHFGRPELAWQYLLSIARQMAIVEIPDPQEGHDSDAVASWHKLRERVLATPGVRVLLSLPGWKPDSHRVLAQVLIDRDAMSSSVEPRAGEVR